MTLSAAACGGGATPTPGPPDPPALFVRALEWNPTSAPVGKVAAIVEAGEELVVLSDSAATVLAGGAPIATDRSVGGWAWGAPLPAADGSGTWVVGIGADGRVRRLRSDGSWDLISDRYGLENDAVQAVVAAGNTTVVFTMASGIAVSDGAEVTRYDVGRLAMPAGGGGRVAGLTAAGVRVFDVVRTEAFDYVLPGAVAVAFDAAARLVATTARTLYVEDAAGALRPRFESAAPIHGLAVSAGRTWLAVGTEVATLEGDSVRRSAGAGLSLTAQLLGSPTGDVWVLDDGRLTRLGPDGAAMARLARWEETISPVFLRVCAACHLPGGVAGFNLSSYSAWIAKRDKIYGRMVELRDMPPQGTFLSEEDRGVLRAWLEDPTR